MGFVDKIEQIDRQLLFAVNGANSPLFDTIMWWVSKPAFGIPFYLLFVFLLYKYCQEYLHFLLKLINFALMITLYIRKAINIPNRAPHTTSVG